MKQKTRTTPGIIIGILILLSLLFLAMYFSTNKGSLQEFTSPTYTPTITVTEFELEEEPDVMAESIEVSDVSQKNIVFFMDNDFNTNRGDEPLCDQCKDISLIASTSADSAKIIIKTDRSAKLTQDIVGDNSWIWGVNTTRSIAVIPTKFGFDDGASDIEIPVWSLSASIAGINSNIVTIEDNDNGLLFTFTKLVPLMKTSFESSKPIYVKLTPDITKPEYFLIYKGIMNRSSEGYDYQLEINDPSIRTIASQESNIEFLLF